MPAKSNKTDFDSTAEFRLKRSRRNKKRGLNGWQKFLLVLIVICCILVLASVGVFAYFKYIHRPGPGPLPDFPKHTTTPDGTTPDSENNGDVPTTLHDARYNFLVVGCDRANWLSDVIMLATYDVKNKSVAIMQIPRDTYVALNSKLILDENGAITADNFDARYGYGSKINATLGHGGSFAASELKRIVGLAEKAKNNAEIDAICKESYLDIDRATLTAYMNATGKAKSEAEYNIRLKFGIRYLSALLTHSFGVPIDFYAQVNLDGFVNIVDAIGGVDVYVQEDMDYDDPLQDLHIHIKKGNQHLDGKKAEGFIRFRYGYAAADIARIDAQKIFMTAFIKKVVSLEGIMNLDNLVKEISANLHTNISIPDALYFATNALDLDFSKIVMLTMPGEADYVGGVSYYLINKEAMMECVNTYLNKFTEPLGEEYFYVASNASKDTSTPPLTADDIDNEQPNLGFLKSRPADSSAAATTVSVNTPADNQPEVLPENPVQTVPDDDVPAVPLDDLFGYESESEQPVISDELSADTDGEDRQLFAEPTEDAA